MKYKRPEIIAYVDGKVLCKVIQAALDNNMTVAELKKRLVEENKGHKVEFKIKR